MIFYLIIIIFLVILLLLKKSNIIENLEPNMVTMSGSPSEISEILNQGNNESSQNVTKTFSEGVYLTNNDINYELLDDKINSLKRQIQLIEYNINNIKINLQIETDTNSSIDPIIKIYGSFPTNIIFHI